MDKDSSWGGQAPTKSRASCQHGSDAPDSHLDTHQEPLFTHVTPRPPGPQAA